MKIKWGMMMTDGRGKLGGQVASKNRSGAYVRTKVTPVNPQTTPQQAIRGLFGSVSAAWRSLTSEQITSWNEATEYWQRTDIFGDLVKPSGFALFQRLNMGLLSNVSAAVLLRDAPMPDTLPVISDVESNLTLASSSTWVVDWEVDAPGAQPGDFSLQIRCTPPMPSGRNYHANQLRVVVQGDALAETYSILDAYIERFGRLPNVNENVYIEVRTVSRQTGRIGTGTPATTNFL